MYQLYDRNSAIKEIQKYLHVISDKVDADVPRISIDGVYGKETEESVRVFQSIYGLDITGVVDLETFNLLYLLYNGAIEEINTKDYIIKDEIFPLRVGDQHNDIIVLHLYLSELEKRYPQLGRAGKSNYYSKNTETIISMLQEIFRYPVTGTVSKSLFARIQEEVNAERILNKPFR